MTVTVTEEVSNEFGFEETTGYGVSTKANSIYAYNMWECPEDATLNRDLSFVFSIPNMLKEAYEAGKNGEDFEIVYKEQDD